jgi:TRAP-type mannitol/chloroaromatic compound transport system permease small subunit
MRQFLSTADRISGASAAAGGAMLVIIMLAMCWEVVARYAFHAPTIWAYELTYLLTGSAWLLAIPYALSRGLHVRVDVLSRMFSERVRAVVDLVGFVLLLLPVLCWLTFALGMQALEAIESGERTGQSAWNPVVWPFYAMFVVSFALHIVQLLAEIVRRVLAVRGQQAEHA